MSNKLEGKTAVVPAAPAASALQLQNDLSRKAPMFSLPAAARKNWMRPSQKSGATSPAYRATSPTWPILIVCMGR